MSNIELWQVLGCGGTDIPQEIKELFETLRFQVSMEQHEIKNLAFIRQQIAETMKDIKSAIQKK
ncbi:MAG: hypothetical protein WAW67_04780 [Candidatus Omnitrophota bacterium]